MRISTGIRPSGHVSSTSRDGPFSRPTIVRAASEARWSLSTIRRSPCFAIVRRVLFSGTFVSRPMRAARALALRSSRLPKSARVSAVLAAFASKRKTSMCRRVASTTPTGFDWSERHPEPTPSCRTRFSCSGARHYGERSAPHVRLMTDSERALAINRAGGSRRTKHRRGRWGPSCAHFPTAIVRRSSTARRSRMSRSSASRSSPGEAPCRLAGTSRSRTSALHPQCSRR